MSFNECRRGVKRWLEEWCVLLVLSFSRFIFSGFFAFVHVWLVHYTSDGMVGPRD